MNLDENSTILDGGHAQDPALGTRGLPLLPFAPLAPFCSPCSLFLLVGGPAGPCDFPIRTPADRRVLLFERDQSFPGEITIYEEVRSRVPKFPDLGKISEIWFPTRQSTKATIGLVSNSSM